MDTSINSDESELFGSPSYVDESPRTASHMKGRYMIPEAPKEVPDEAQEALTAESTSTNEGKGRLQSFMWETWSSLHPPRS